MFEQHRDMGDERPDVQMDVQREEETEWSAYMFDRNLTAEDKDQLRRMRIAAE